jgi:hypothetical protein
MIFGDQPVPLLVVNIVTLTTNGVSYILAEITFPLKRHPNLMLNF